MTLAAAEFMRRFLIHVLPSGLHRIRHYELFANGGRAANLRQARALLCVEQPPAAGDSDEEDIVAPARPCPNCGALMVVIDVVQPAYRARASPPRTGCPP